MLPDLLSAFAPNSPLPRGVRALLHGLVWALVLVLSLPLFLQNGLTAPLVHAGVALALVLAYFYANVSWLIPDVFERGHPWRYLGLTLALCFGLVALRMGVERWWFQDELLRAFPTLLRYRLYTLMVFSITGTVAFLLRLLRARRMAERREQELRRHQQESQLLHLRAQINPHFLFNTLNNIYVLTLSGSAQAPDAVLRLAGLLRYAIYSTGRATVPAAEEMTQIEQLLALHRLRFATPPDLRLTVPAAAAGQVEIEPMLLIPLVENSLKHGDLGLRPDAFAHFTLRLEVDALVFVAENAYDAADHAKDATPGVGLANVRRRLALSYPGAGASLHTHADAAARRFRAELRVPLGAANHLPMPAAPNSLALPLS